jgi:hypothetical protein
MEPTREEIEQALLSAFPDRASLEMMVYYKFGVNLETISSSESNLLVAVSSLMIWAEAGGGLGDLVTRASARNPDNQKLLEITERFKQLEPSSGTGQTTPDKQINLLPVIGTRLKDEDLEATREFLFKGHPLLGRVFTTRPWKLFTSSFALVLLFLMGLAWWFGVHRITRSDGLRVGFWQSQDRAALYLIILPLFFAGTVWLSNYMRAIIKTLVNGRVKIITRKDGEEATDYEQVLSGNLAKMARPLLAAALLFTLAFMFLDTYKLWYGYSQYSKDISHNFKLLDWKVAFIGPPTFDLPPGKPTITQNLAFDIVVYFFQSVAIFLGLFWVAKFWIYLKVFSDSMDPSESPYRFNPLAYDPYKRLGLYPMGRLFNGFLLIAVGYQIYVFSHRIQLINLSRPQDKTFFQVVRDALNPFNLADPNSYHFADVTAGLWLLLIFSTVPILIVSYFSLLTLRRYVLEQRERAFLENGSELEAARKTNNQARAKLLKEKIDLLKDASVWPNGDITAMRFLFIIGALGLASIFPPLLVYLAALGLILEVWGSIIRARHARA